MDTPLRSLYLCYLSLDDPLVHTQVLAYLSGLVDAGHTVHLLTYDRPLDAARRRQIDDSMRESGIGWHSLRYHKRPSLPATVYDALAGAVVAARIVRRHGLTALHARNHVPLATALIARRLTGSRLIFDIRGLMAEEYADAGRWKEGGIPYRLTQRMQRAGLRQADAIVTLTEAVRPHLFGAATRPGTRCHPLLRRCRTYPVTGRRARPGENRARAGRTARDGLRREIQRLVHGARDGGVLRRGEADRAAARVPHPYAVGSAG